MVGLLEMNQAGKWNVLVVRLLDDTMASSGCVFVGPEDWADQVILAGRPVLTNRGSVRPVPCCALSARVLTLPSAGGPYYFTAFSMFNVDTLYVACV